MDDLLKVTEETLAAHRALERQRGSGWHPADPGALQREERGELFLSERPVAVQDNDRVHVVGEQVARVRAALEAFLARLAADPETDLIGSGEKYQRSVAAMCRRALAQGGHIELPTQEWNYANEALRAQGVQAALASLPTPPRAAAPRGDG